MEAGSPLGTCHFLDLDGLRSPEVTFWSIWSGDELAGCGALKELDASHGEVKSMRTADTHQRQGVGTVVLAHLLDVARQRNYLRVSLETGSGDGFAAAHRLYARFGFVECEPFADYTPNGFSRFLTLTL